MVGDFTIFVHFLNLLSKKERKRCIYKFNQLCVDVLIWLLPQQAKKAQQVWENCTTSFQWNVNILASLMTNSTTKTPENIQLNAMTVGSTVSNSALLCCSYHASIHCKVLLSVKFVLTAGLRPFGFNRLYISMNRETSWWQRTKTPLHLMRIIEATLF